MTRKNPIFNRKSGKGENHRYQQQVAKKNNIFGNWGILLLIKPHLTENAIKNRVISINRVDGT
jgi:hypothetical protein